MLHNKWLRKITALIHVGKKEPVMITAKVGTFKRKQQMRDFLDHLPKDNHDDIFTATPFQNRRVKVNSIYTDGFWFMLFMFQGCAPTLPAPCQQQTLSCAFGRGGSFTGLRTGGLWGCVGHGSCCWAVLLKATSAASLQRGASPSVLQWCCLSGGCSLDP